MQLLVVSGQRTENNGKSVKLKHRSLKSKRLQPIAVKSLYCATEQRMMGRRLSLNIVLSSPSACLKLVLSPYIVKLLVVSGQRTENNGTSVKLKHGSLKSKRLPKIGVKSLDCATAGS